jgi:hypothetical protein
MCPEGSDCTPACSAASNQRARSVCSPTPGTPQRWNPTPSTHPPALPSTAAHGSQGGIPAGRHWLPLGQAAVLPGPTHDDPHWTNLRSPDQSASAPPQGCQAPPPRTTTTPQLRHRACSWGANTLSPTRLVPSTGTSPRCYESRPDRAQSSSLPCCTPVDTAPARAAAPWLAHAG